MLWVLKRTVSVIWIYDKLNLWNVWIFVCLLHMFEFLLDRLIPLRCDTDCILYENIYWEECVINFMGENFQDYSWIQDFKADFEADFP